MVFDSFQYWQEPHNTHWIHEDGSKPFCMGWGQTISQKPPLSLSSALETRTHQSSGHSSINAGRLERQFPAPDLLDVSPGQACGLQSWGDPDVSSLLCLSRGMVLATGTGLGWHVWSCRRSTAGFSYGFMFILVTELSKADQHKMQWNKVPSDKRTRMFWHQTFPKHIQTTKLYQVEFQGLVTRSKIKI